MNSNILLLYLFLSSLIVINSDEKVIFAWQIHRHGARAPYDGIIKGLDAYREKWISKEELSEVGKRMLYLLGVKARKRYMDKYNLLSKEYNPQEIFIRSTDVNRTIESIESFLQGLYPPGTGPIINEKLTKDLSRTYPPNVKYLNEFKEISDFYNLTDNISALPYRMSLEPVHLFYKPRHEFQLYDTDVCKGHKEKYEQQKNSKIVHDFGDELNEKFDDMFFKLEVTENKAFFHEYWTIYKYMDSFICDETDARKFNHLLQNFNFDENKFNLLREYSKKYLLLDYNSTNYPEGYNNISIVANSFTMHSILNWMEKAIEGNKNKQNYLKYVVFSAHDSSIGAIEHFMNYVFQTEIEYAEFAESRYLELYIDDNDKYKVRYLKGDTYEKKSLDFEKFKKEINDKIWTDQEVGKFCQFEESPKETIIIKEKSSSSPSFIFMIILIIINIILLLVIIMFCVKK